MWARRVRVGRPAFGRTLPGISVMRLIVASEKRPPVINTILRGFGLTAVDNNRAYNSNDLLQTVLAREKYRKQ